MMLNRMRHHPWWPREPIERKVIFLVFMLMVMGGTLIGMDTLQKHMILRLDLELDNHSARHDLGKVLMNRLLQIERDVILLSTIEDDRDLQVTHNRLQQFVGDIKSLLTVLQKGGTFDHVRPMNFNEVNEVTEHITILPESTSHYVIEVIELTPKILDIEQLSGDMMTASLKKTQSKAHATSETCPFAEIILLRKQIEPVILRSREFANKILYDTNIRIQELGTTRQSFIQKVHIFRITLSGGVLLFGLVVSFRSLRQIKGIIQERTAYLQNLREANDSINLMVESLPVGITVMDQSRTIRHVNQAALEILQAGHRNQVVGKKCNDVSCENHDESCPVLCGESTALCNETELITLSGNRTPVIKRAIRLRLDNEDVILEALVDISERKRAEMDILEKQNYINTIINSAAVGIVVVDATEHTIVEANPTAVAMIGLPKTQILGSRCQSLLCASETDRCPITDDGRSVHNKECTLSAANGRKLPIVKNATRAVLNGRTHLVESFIDISQLKKAQEKARRLNEELEKRVNERTDQLQKTNQELSDAMEELKNAQSRLLQSDKMASIGQLAAGVAHEINNPVGFVKSNLHTMQEYQTDLMRLVKAYEAYEACCRRKASDGEIAAQLVLISDTRKEIDIEFMQSDFESVHRDSAEGIHRVAEIVADLKDFAHVDSDELIWADINAGIDSTLKIVWNELKYKTEVHKDLGHLPPVNCYPRRLNQVFMNLLVNAGQAIDKRGRIYIKTRAAENSVTVTLSDNGRGIAQEHIDKIFDPFFTTKDVGEGTGLGLNVVYNVVRSHQGHVDVRSAPGEGTTFTIHLPVNAADAAYPASERPISMLWPAPAETISN